ncbi:tripartite tricarboxylate transporter substrate binding protein [Aneurinibacillus tyrosinisolvens]|uniref:tripartite tricarboxylate transporter substrate binding protein n=1 Tax=Aneurinibacillus tyrosinisolvens TaxID=1443435 RepID=UPI00063F3C4B|nr:tripartite tricarboxylate transporter substrate binding protein [Aneurinibacillus tyrosinisolvens]
MKNIWKSFTVSAALVGMLALTACGGGGGTTTGGQAAGGTAEKAASGGTGFPKRSVTLLVPHAAGGGTDSTARALAKAAEKHLGKPIVVVNKPGGGGAIGMTEGAKSNPDGYMVTMATVELTTLPHMNLSQVTYKDFKPIAQINFDPAAITVRADAPYKNVKEFLDYAKANPGKVKMGNSGVGSIWHLAAAAVEKAAGVTFNHVPFDGGKPAVMALMGGHIDAVPVSPAEVKAQVEAGKLKTLAIIDAQPSEALPGVKTLEEETGIKATYVGPWRGVVVPKDTPDDVVKVLTDAFMKGAEEEEFKTYMKKNGLGLVVKDSEGFKKLIEDSHESFGKLIPELGLKK